MLLPECHEPFLLLLLLLLLEALLHDVLLHQVTALLRGQGLRGK